MTAAGPASNSAPKKLVRVGVALLGVRIVVSDVSALGLWGILGLAGAVVFTLCFGVLMARVLRVSPMFGLLSGGGTGICGISATMAISSTLPQSPESERCTLMSAIGIASLSTAVMVLYPLWVRWFGMTVPEAGLFLGGSIHDVAQVVGAGSILSPDIAKAATLAKMFRVAMLVPVVLTLSLVFRRTVAAEAGMAHPPRRPAIAATADTGTCDDRVRKGSKGNRVNRVNRVIGRAGNGLRCCTAGRIRHVGCVRQTPALVAVLSVDVCTAGGGEQSGADPSGCAARGQ